MRRAGNALRLLDQLAQAEDTFFHDPVQVDEFLLTLSEARHHFLFQLGVAQHPFHQIVLIGLQGGEHLFGAAQSDEKEQHQNNEGKFCGCNGDNRCRIHQVFLLWFGGAFSMEMPQKPGGCQVRTFSSLPTRGFSLGRISPAFSVRSFCCVFRSPWRGSRHVPPFPFSLSET